MNQKPKLCADFAARLRNELRSVRALNKRQREPDLKECKYATAVSCQYWYAWYTQ